MWMIFACTADKDAATDDTGAPDSGDTAESGDTSGDTSADTSRDTSEDSGDSGDPPPPVATLVFETEAGDRPLTLFPFDIREDPPPIGPPWLGAPGGSPLELPVPPPPKDMLIEVDPEGLPGMYAAFFLPTLHDDDGDDHWEDGEPFDAAGRTWPVYLEGTVPIELVAQGFFEGWNAMRLESDGKGTRPVSVPIDAIPLPSNLALREEITLAGSATTIPEGAEIGLFSSYAEGTAPVPPLATAPFATAWSLLASGGAGVTELDPVGIFGDLALLAVWTDTDGDGAGAPDGELDWTVCDAGGNLGGLWIDPVSTPDAAYVLAAAGVPAGWTAVRFGETGLSVLTEEESVVIDADVACPM